MITIKPEYKDAFQCYQAVGVSIAKYYKCDYELAFLSAWNFTYQKRAGEKLGDRIGIIEKLTFFDLLYYFYGIKLTRLYVKQFEKKIQILLSEFDNNNPVLIYTDTYECPWCRFHKKQHFDHVILALGMNEQNEIRCIDPYFTNDFVIIKFDFLSMQSSDIGTVRCEVPKAYFNIDNILQIIMYSIETNGLPNYKYMELFVQDFKDEFSIQEEFSNVTNVWDAKIFDMLQKARKSTSAFLISISYLAENFEDDIQDLNEIKALLTDIVSDWSLLTNILLKMFLTKNMYLKNIAVDKLESINAKERCIYQIFYQKHVEKNKRGVYDI